MRKNPIITTFVDGNAFSNEDRFDTGKEGFQIAVALGSVTSDP